MRLSTETQLFEPYGVLKIHLPVALMCVSSRSRENQMTPVSGKTTARQQPDSFL